MKRKTLMVRLRWLMAIAFGAALVPATARAVDGSQVVSGGGVIEFTGASETNWVANTEVGGYDFLIYYTNTTETGTFTLPGATKATILAVGGGGGAGGSYDAAASKVYDGGSGGGGAGGVLETNDLLSAATYHITVGSGGQPGKLIDSRGKVAAGQNGEDTFVKKGAEVWLTAIGGGGGGGNGYGQPGGSGGGGSLYRESASSGQQREGGAGTVGQGNAGGLGAHPNNGGGGGGAGEKGGDSSADCPGKGGDGRMSKITGPEVWYGGGGGGGNNDKNATSAADGAAGGKGGGGKGGVGKKIVNPENGVPGTGGGGGGSSYNVVGGAGGSGVVIVRIAASIKGGLDRPKNVYYTYDGQEHVSYRSTVFYKVTGDNVGTNVGNYVAWVKPLDVTWTGGGDEAVPVVMTIMEPSSVCGVVTVTGTPIEYYGASEDPVEIDNGDGTSDWLIKFSGAGSYKFMGTTKATVLAVGGGGGAGGSYDAAASKAYDGGSGGGGGGGMIETNVVVSAETYFVSVGLGGKPGKLVDSRSRVGPGENGGNTIIQTSSNSWLTAIGGGGGGGNGYGQPGGSGGGGSLYRESTSSGQQREGGAGAVGQGNAGGLGAHPNHGGGGGGAGEKGGDSSAACPGKGGDGRMSKITGPEVWYGGGGGGGNNDKNATSAADGAAGGKGGGGKGGVGKKIVNPENGDPCTGGGGGGSGFNVVGGAGGSGVVYVRISAAMIGELKKPSTEPQVITYDANAHTSIVANGFYDVTGRNVGTNVDTYVAHVVLKGKEKGASWPDGTKDDVDVTMKIVPVSVTFANLKQTGWTYGDKTVPAPTCDFTPTWMKPVYEYATAKESAEWSAQPPENAGSYWIRVRAPDDVNYTGDPAYAQFSVAKCDVTITELKIRDWMAGTPDEATPKPTCTVTPDWVVPSYTYGTQNVESVWIWSDQKPTTVGTHKLRADVPDANNFRLMPGSETEVTFKIVKGLGNIFTDYVEITIDGYTGTNPSELTNFPYRVSISETSPVGFLYSRVDRNGEAMAFTDASGDNLLPYEIGETGWNTNGTTVIYVKLPRIGSQKQVIRLYWHVRYGATAPAHDPESVWSDWTEEEYAKITNPPKQTFESAVYRDGYLVNYWTKLPQMSNTFWDTLDPESKFGKITQDAEARFDNKKVTKVITNLVTGATYSSIPSREAGTYRVSYTMIDPDLIYVPLEAHVDFTIIGHNPWDDLKGDAKTLTLSGRVMLANDDTAPGHEVSDQGYWQTREVDIGGGKILTNDVYWTHTGEHEREAKKLPNLQPGRSHRLNYIGEDGSTNVLWRFDDVMIGGVFASSGNLYSYQCALPWSENAMCISSYAKRNEPADKTETGTIVLCNKVGAVVYSPCYTNGIGTIYFDAVNGWYVTGDESSHIVVEVATATEDGLPPTDANAADPKATGPEAELGKIKTAQWVPYEMRPMLREGTTTFTALEPTKDLLLNVKTVPSSNNFYRICVDVNYRGPVRFRIRRSKSNEIQPVDTDRLILLDNIVVSYPRMGAEVEAYGHFDPERIGNRTLGQEGAMMCPFPSVTDEAIIGRGAATTYVNGSTNANPAGFIGLTKMHYRWRYLTQESNDWATVDLSPGNGFVAADPLVVPQREGDVEWWYESFVNLPYYEYFDYSGTGANLKGADGKPLYTEERTAVTNRSDNWFFRFRRGKSELETIRIHARTTDDEGVATVETSDMELSRDNVWRGYIRTPQKLEKGIEVRFETINRQVAGSAEFVTNVTTYAFNAETDETGKVQVYAAGTLVPAGKDVWTTVACDATTGYLLFQVEEQTMGTSVVHADYQNFNRWSDANKPSGLFVGTSTDTNSFSMSGSSEVTREYRAPLDSWRLSIATNDYWSEPFKVEVEEMQPSGAYELFKPFTSSRLSPNGFTVGPGQWVSGYYREVSEASGMALQMEGKGKGYIQFVNAAEAPRGIESVSFRARLGQFIEFNDFSYYAGESQAKMTNYTFVTRAAYDLNQRRDFAGNASLSVVAFYRPGIGCYEFRVEQYNATKNASGDVTGPGNTQRLSLYRWSYDSVSGEVTATLLGSANLVNNDVLKTASLSGTYNDLFISVKNTATGTEVCAGLSLTAAVRGTTPNSENCYWLTILDTDGKRLRNGTYGVLAANSKGRFVSLIQGRTATTFPDTSKKAFTAWPSRSFAFPSSRKWCAEDIAASYEESAWNINPKRVEIESAGDAANCALVAKEVEQPLVISIAKPGTTDWKTLMVTNVSNFGALASPIVVNLWDKEECSLQISTGGDAGTARNDVVIDDLEIRQWRGESYDGKEGSKYFPDVSYGSPTNFVFTQAWLLPGADGATNCQLSAKRSLATEATSIRSPLMDGKTSGGYKRGSGLGMFSFSYTNAQPNVNLLLQIATNGIDSTTLPSMTKSIKAGEWTTVTNYSFAGLSKEELASGTRSYYFGLHGVSGAMRIVMDPEVVNAVSNSTDTSAFGSIDITSVLCRDEPVLDRFSWWGWNLRTTNDKLLMNVSDVERVETENGLSAGLNNSVVKDIVEADREQYPKHLPFIQTPTFDSEVVGEVSFKARKYSREDPDTRVTLFGAKNGLTEDEKAWTRLKSWTVDNTTFASHNDAGEDYTYKTAPGDSYCAFRFAVTGVEGVTNPMKDPQAPDNPERVLLDEILVQEAIRAQVAFRNVAAFRSHLDTLWPITNIMARSEQPLCKEAWGVQAEVYASQLAEEVDLSNAKVRLWWYESDYPWGFEKWREKSGAQNAWLSSCEGTNLVYRSSYFGATGSVMSPQDKPLTVQYTLEVIYKTSRGEPVTNWLSKADWVKPPWYDPVDYNADYGDAEGVFSAYTILDTVAPGWAWINESNIFDAYDWSWNNSDRYKQFIEIAAPSDADLSNWKIRFLDAQIDAKRIVTNEVATFGSTLPGLKKDLKGIDPDSGCVFHVLASPRVLEYAPSYLDASKGEVDGYWRRPDNTTQGVSSSGEIQSYYPVTIQLVRPSGIIEHEITAIGTNYYWDTSSYQPENHAKFIEAHERGTRKIPVVGADERGSEAAQARGWSRSLGVFAGSGDSAMQWNNISTMTPGRKNEGQVIDPNCPHPYGSSIVIYAILDGEHLEQSVGGLPRTNATVTVLCQKGGEGTNIVYTAAPWYQLGTVTTNKVVTYATETNLAARTYTLQVGRGASNDVMVVASADIDDNLVKNYGLGLDNRYREAIMKWLTTGCDLYGNLWANPGSGVIKLAQYWPYSGNPTAYRDMSLTEMYWLDIDPTEGDWILKAGFVEPARPVYDYANEITNVRMSVYMMISNLNENAEWTVDPLSAHKLAHAPYALRGLAPDSSTWDYSLTSPNVWTSVTFKITGFMNNGLTQISNPTNWIPLRWFGFHDGSFAARGTAKEFQSTIDVRDPYSKSSPAYSYGWYQWWLDHGTKPIIYYGWSIDERLKPITVDVLTPNSTY